MDRSDRRCDGLGRDGFGRGAGGGLRVQIEARYETIPPARESFDIAGRVRRVLKGAAELANRGIQACVEVDDALRPQQTDELLAGDHAAGVVNQHLEKQGRLLLEPDPAAGALQVPRFGVQNPPIEAEFLGCHAGSASDQR